MIICVNGKSVGGMTEVEFQIEMDVCGSEMILVVSRLDIQQQTAGTNEKDPTLEELTMDWNDVGAGAVPSTKKRVSFGDGEHENNATADIALHSESGRCGFREHRGDQSANEAANPSNITASQGDKSIDVASTKPLASVSKKSSTISKKRDVDKSDEQMQSSSKFSTSLLAKKSCSDRTVTRVVTRVVTRAVARNEH